MSSQTIVKAVELSKIFKDFWGRPKVKAVDRINIEIKKGEVYGLLGPNGSGKSTTLKMMLGLLFPTKGKITIFDKPVTNVKVKEKIGFLPEESYLYGYLTARETLKFYGNLFNISSSAIDKRADALLEMVGLGKAAKRSVKEFSKGMARRLGLAQALINDPELIFLDEPTSGLDPIGTRQIKDMIIDLKNKGKTILLCSHLLADVEDVCDRISILYGGKIRVEGQVGELLKKEDSIQINLPELKPETIAEIKKIISESENGTDFKIEHPKDRLENFFLKVVRQAVDEKSETAGAQLSFKPETKEEDNIAPQQEQSADKELIKQLLNKENK